MRTNSSAVSGSRAPSLAECRASATSSCGPRAEASSSAGSRPMRRTMRLAVLLRWRDERAEGGAEASAAASPTRLATASGREIAQFFGTSSPTTIRTTVDSAVPMHQRQAERGRRAGDAERLQRARDQRGDRRLGEHADDQVGDGDAELGAGELEGQAPYGLQRARPRPARRARRPAPARRARPWSGRTPPRRRRRRRASSRSATRSRSTSVIGSPPSHDRAGRERMRGVAVPGGSPMGGRSQPFMKDRVAIQE